MAIMLSKWTLLLYYATKNLKPFFNVDFLYINFSHIKISKDSSAKYYQKTKKISKTAGEKYPDLSEKENIKKRYYAHKRYKNLLKHEKQSLVEYRKKIF